MHKSHELAQWDYEFMREHCTDSAIIENWVTKKTMFDKKNGTRSNYYVEIFSVINWIYIIINEEKKLLAHSESIKKHDWFYHFKDSFVATRFD